MSYSIIKSIGVSDFLISYNELKDKICWLESPNKGKQTGLQCAAGEDPFLSATGSLQSSREENEYTQLNPLFKGTVFENIIKEYNLYRTRLMWVEPKTCYSLHQDKSQRIHIPLVTNKNCMFLFPNEPLVHLPAGYVYSVDTRKTHTFCNFSDHARLHLLGCY
jgi:hypothetical protein